jgi:hypothetical protein
LSVWGWEATKMRKHFVEFERIFCRVRSAFTKWCKSRRQNTKTRLTQKIQDNPTTRPIKKLIAFAISFLICEKFGIETNPTKRSLVWVRARSEQRLEDFCRKNVSSWMQNP